MRSLRLAAFIGLTAAVLSLASAAAQEVELWSDPAGDVAVTGGGLVTTLLASDDFADVDLLRAAASEADGTLRLSIDAGAEVADDTFTRIVAQVEATPSSLSASTANGTSFTWILDGASIRSGPVATVALDEGRLQLDVSRDVLGAVGGDALRLAEITRSRDTGDVLPLVAPGENATDAFEGTATPYIFERPQLIAAADLFLLNGTLTDATGTYTFTSFPVATEDPDALIEARFRLRNIGTDADTFSITVDAAPGGVASTTAPSATLDPQDALEIPVRLQFVDAAAEVELRVDVSSVAGVDIAFASTITVVGPPESTPTIVPPPATPPAGPAPRTPDPAGLTWLTPMAEGLGFDDRFDERAEAVLLVVIMLFVAWLAVGLWAATRARRKLTPLVDEPEADAPAVEAAPEPLIEALTLQAVKQQLIPGKPTIVLDDLEHLPERAGPGEQATSTITIENQGQIGARLRTVLEVNGQILGDKTVACPAGQRVRVRFPWRGGRGDNQPIIRVYPA